MKPVYWVVLCTISALAAAVGWFFWPQIAAFPLWRILTDQQKLETLIRSFGPWAPAIFIGLQVLQVVFAPVPGEITGFLGGYLFGAAIGLVYSTIGLSIGSILNFYLGRLLGQGIVFRIVPQQQVEKLAYLVKPKAVLGLFLLFVFPGFPKDYLCLFLGLTTMRFSLFFWIAAVGRIPGTLMLSLQGASLMQRNYSMFLWLAICCVLLAGLSYRYREPLLRWIERYSERTNQQKNG
ncbi:MAG: VTT domain-containing protein [Thermodesulfobacteriota bacterium]